MTPEKKEMDDATMLELAAVAVGLRGYYNSITNTFYREDAQDGERKWWDPRSSKEDSLDLLTSLGLSLMLDKVNGSTAGIVAKGKLVLACAAGADSIADEVVRRTITLAAARLQQTKDGDARTVSMTTEELMSRVERRRAEGSTQHDLYKDGDPDAPDSIKDRNGEVVLGLCKACGRGEIELSEPCAPRQGKED